MTLIDQLKQISDFRYVRGWQHPLWMILLLSLLGFLCGYGGYRPLADFCELHQSSLRPLLGLPDSQTMPSDSTFRRNFQQLPPQGWIESFNTWAIASLPPIATALLSIDGNIRCTSTGGNTSAQNFVSLVSVYEQTVGVLQLALMHNCKTSEIHVAQALIAQLPSLPAGQCFSLDALHTTQATATLIVATQQHYRFTLKQNRADTHAAVHALTQTQAVQSEITAGEESHGRSVVRHVQVFAPTPHL